MLYQDYCPVVLLVPNNMTLSLKGWLVASTGEVVVPGRSPSIKERSSGSESSSTTTRCPTTGSSEREGTLSADAAVFVPGQWVETAEPEGLLGATDLNTGGVEQPEQPDPFYFRQPFFLPAEEYVFPDFSLDIKIAGFRETVAAHKSLPATAPANLAGAVAGNDAAPPNGGAFGLEDVERGERDGMLKSLLDVVSPNVRALMVVVKSWIKLRINVFLPARRGGPNSISANLLVLVYVFRVVAGPPPPPPGDGRDDSGAEDQDGYRAREVGAGGDEQDYDTPCLFSTKYFRRNGNFSPPTKNNSQQNCTLKSLLALKSGAGAPNAKWYYREGEKKSEKNAKPDAFAVLDLFFGFLGFFTRECVQSRGLGEISRYRFQFNYVNQRSFPLPYRVWRDPLFSAEFVEGVHARHPGVLSGLYLSDPDAYLKGTLALRDIVEVVVEDSSTSLSGPVRGAPEVPPVDETNDDPPPGVPGVPPVDETNDDPPPGVPGVPPADETNDDPPSGVPGVPPADESSRISRDPAALHPRRRRTRSYPGVVVGLRRRSGSPPRSWSQRAPLIDSIHNKLDRVEVFWSEEGADGEWRTKQKEFGLAQIVENRAGRMSEEEGDNFLLEIVAGHGAGKKTVPMFGGEEEGRKQEGVDIPQGSLVALEECSSSCGEGASFVRVVRWGGRDQHTSTLEVGRDLQGTVFHVGSELAIRSRSTFLS